jgi:hypothetical protein
MWHFRRSKWHWDRFFLEHFTFTVSLSFHRWSILIDLSSRLNLGNCQRHWRTNWKTLATSSAVLLQKLLRPQLIKKFPADTEPDHTLPCHNSQLLVPLWVYTMATVDRSLLLILLSYGTCALSGCYFAVTWLFLPGIINTCSGISLTAFYTSVWRSGKKPCSRTVTCPSTIFSITNPTRNGLHWNWIATTAWEASDWLTVRTWPINHPSATLHVSSSSAPSWTPVSSITTWK